MKIKNLPIQNPIGLGIAVGAILLGSSPRLRRKIREFVVKGVSATMGLTGKFDQMQKFEEAYESNTGKHTETFHHSPEHDEIHKYSHRKSEEEQRGDIE